MKTRTPTKAEREWMNKVGEFGCIVCAICEDEPDVPCSVHHIEGRTKPGAHMKTIGLCFLHHQSNDSNPAYESVHGNKARFEEMYGSQYKLLEITQGFLNEAG